MFELFSKFKDFKNILRKKADISIEMIVIVAIAMLVLLILVSVIIASKGKGMGLICYVKSLFGNSAC